MDSNMQYNTGLSYTAEKNKLVLIALLKKYGIRNIIVSPGATNVTFVASLQHDDYFKLYSCVDERSAAFMALGVAHETKSPVVLSCTGATSSRDYFPALTEAFYRGLPILVVTSSLSSEFVGHGYPQVTDREHPPFDIVKATYLLQNVKDQSDYWDCTIKINKALNLLCSDDKGPVHINLETEYNSDFSIKELPDVQEIRVLTTKDELPEIRHKNIAIFIGSHKKISGRLEQEIDSFCENNNAVVLCDHTSNYYGKYKLKISLLFVQENPPIKKFDLIIYLGDITGDYYTAKALFSGEMWKISEDGEIKDRFRNIKYIFKMSDETFFYHYKNIIFKKNTSHYDTLFSLLHRIEKMIPELPFSNIWIAQQTAKMIPKDSSVHLGILNSLRAWNFFDFQNGVTSYCNVGGFGIDGCMSSLIGASLTNCSKLYFGIFGDLSFFYDMNVLKNRGIGSNVRILLVNNGRGTEFRNYSHPAAIIGKAVDPYVAAAGHFGCQSETTIKRFAIACGFDYMYAHNKNEYLVKIKGFVTNNHLKKPIVFEVFTDSDDESDALKIVSSMVKGRKKRYLSQFKLIIKRLLNK